MYSNHGDSLPNMPKPRTLRQFVEAAAKGAAVMPDVANRCEGKQIPLLPETHRMVDAADLWNLQYTARNKLHNVRNTIKDLMK